MCVRSQTRGLAWSRAAWEEASRYGKQVGHQNQATPLKPAGSSSTDEAGMPDLEAIAANPPQKENSAAQVLAAVDVVEPGLRKLLALMPMNHVGSAFERDLSFVLQVRNASGFAEWMEAFGARDQQRGHFNLRELMRENIGTKSDGRGGAMQRIEAPFELPRGIGSRSFLCQEHCFFVM